jgi:hypothetical protein
LALPAPSIILVTLVYTISTLRAGIGIPGDISGDTTNVLMRAFSDQGYNRISQGADERFKKFSQA